MNTKRVAIGSRCCGLVSCGLWEGWVRWTILSRAARGPGVDPHRPIVKPPRELTTEERGLPSGRQGCVDSYPQGDRKGRRPVDASDWSAIGRCTAVECAWSLFCRGCIESERLPYGRQPDKNLWASSPVQLQALREIIPPTSHRPLQHCYRQLPC